MSDLANRLSRISPDYTAEQIRILIYLLDNRYFYNGSSPYDSRGLIRMDIHHAVHPWTHGDDKKRCSKAWIDGFDELIRHGLVKCITTEDGDLNTITKKGVQFIEKLKSEFNEKLKTKKPRMKCSHCKGMFHFIIRKTGLCESCFTQRLVTTDVVYNDTLCRVTFMFNQHDLVDVYVDYEDATISIGDQDDYYIQDIVAKASSRLGIAVPDGMWSSTVR